MWFRGSFGGFPGVSTNLFFINVQATVSECLSCVATSLQNGAAADACRAGDAANVAKYGHWSSSYSRFIFNQCQPKHQVCYLNQMSMW